ncbi:alpha-L-arabinofuranosidase C-terminal domain-containing protein [Arachidicoccus sp.]|uniref:alpha-L-arabinofuranosidase C-terminal domain-containing protein n=1 Tax=Arachidicoccus sp. TaxID=1872624 RepID=UPI003D1D865D
MKKIVFALLSFLSGSVFAQNATIKIDVSRVIGKISPRIYGVFMEPIHFNGAKMGLPDTVQYNTLYGTLYDPSSPLADNNGFRKDYIDAMKELKITNMRWPGGNYLMQYNWEDGIGPQDKRPSRLNLAWGGTDNNHVGTDEWIELNKSIGSENVVCVNLGLGTIFDAVHWVEYCNYPKGTYYSDLRAKYGHPQPYNVKIWDLGNEVDGAPWELGHKDADDYVKIAREAAKAMKSVDSSIEFVASGSSDYDGTGKWVDWNRKVLNGLGDKIGYISIHRYWEKSPDYYTSMGTGAMDFEQKINVTADEINIARAKNNFANPIYLSVDEYGSFGKNFLAVLPLAQCLNSFIRHADVVKMANFTMLTSLLSSDPEKGTFKSPIFYTYKLFSNNCKGSSIDTYVDCDKFSTTQYKDIPYLDVTSVYNKENNTVIINVVNRNKDKSIGTSIINTNGAFMGKAGVSIVDCKDVNAPFSFDDKTQYIPVMKDLDVKEGKLSYSFPPHSFTQIKVKVDE